MSERDYLRGSRAAWLRILSEAVRELGPEGTEESWRVERAEAVAALRRVCDHHGDNNWPDGLNLADAIEKHLGRYLG